MLMPGGPVCELRGRCQRGVFARAFTLNQTPSRCDYKSFLLFSFPSLSPFLSHNHMSQCLFFIVVVDAAEAWSAAGKF